MKIVLESATAYRELLSAWSAGQSATVIGRHQTKGSASKELEASLSYAGEPALITWTSGTTGNRKGVVIPWAVVGERCALEFEAFGGAEKLAVTMSMFGQGTWRVMPAKMGVTVAEFPTGDMAAASREITEQGVTTLFAAPDLIRSMIDKGMVPKTHVLKQVIIAGAPLDDEAHQKIAAAFGVPVLNCYGSTEAGVMAVSDGNSAELRPVDHADIRTVSGTVEVKTQCLAERWLNAPFPLADGYYQTGDKGEFMGEALAIHGRWRAGDAVNVRVA